MGDIAAELRTIQEDIALVKNALRGNTAFLGMSGETLQRHFLQLNEKENLVLSTQLSTLKTGSSLSDLLFGATKLPSAGGEASTAETTNGAGYASSAAPVPVARELPAGEVKAFDRESLDSVFAHMSAYEASAAESCKTFRALASLAYTNAPLVGDHPEVLPEVLRLLSLHRTEEPVQINGMRALCNMAYDTKVALNKLSSREVLSAFVGAMSRKPNSKEIFSKASEAVARVVAAEVGPDAATPPVPAEKGPLTALFTVVSYDDPAGRDVVVQLVQQLVSNEVTTPEVLVQRLVDLAEPSTQSGPASASWLMLAKQIAMAEISTMSELLITHGAIASAASVMMAQHSHAPTQLAGIEAMSGLVGSRWVGLQAFAAVKGIERIEDAMRAHTGQTVLQTKGIRALGSGILWPEDIQLKAGYDYKQGVTLTKAAMAKHGDSEDLHVAGLEAISKYLERKKCVEVVKQDGGMGLIKAVMTRHVSIDKVKTLGASILETLGEKDWKPRNQGA